MGVMDVTSEVVGGGGGIATAVAEWKVQISEERRYVNDKNVKTEDVIDMEVVEGRKMEPEMRKYTIIFYYYLKDK